MFELYIKREEFLSTVMPYAQSRNSRGNRISAKKCVLKGENLR